MNLYSALLSALSLKCSDIARV